MAVAQVLFLSTKFTIHLFRGVWSRLSARRSRRGCLNVCFTTFWALENLLNALRPSLQALLITCCRWFMIPCLTLKLVPKHEGKETRSYARMEKGEHRFCRRGGHQAGDRIRSGVRLRRPGDRYHFVSLCVVRQMLAFRAPGKRLKSGVDACSVVCSTLNALSTGRLHGASADVPNTKVCLRASLRRGGIRKLGQWGC